MARVRIEDIDEVDELPTREHILRSPKSEYRRPLERHTTKRKHLYGAVRVLKEYQERD